MKNTRNARNRRSGRKAVKKKLSESMVVLHTLYVRPLSVFLSASFGGGAASWSSGRC